GDQREEEIPGVNPHAAEHAPGPHARHHTAELLEHEGLEAGSNRTRTRASSSPRKSRAARHLLPVLEEACRRIAGACWASPSRPWPRSSWPRRPACAPHLWAWL